MSTDTTMLERIRKLLTQAEDDAVTTAEAEAFTAKAAELMARYGIDRAILADRQPGTDQPADKIITISNPWASVHAHLLCGIAAAMRCQCILLAETSGARVHVFGYASDVERAELLYTSVLIQLSHGLARATVPEWTSSPRAWRRSWLLGFATAVIGRVKAAEQKAASNAGDQAASSRPTALVLASREQVIASRAKAAYPHTRKSRTTYSGSGYRDGHAKGTQADLGTARVNLTPRRELH
jgi:Protein of unknown function (DUF2786)